MKKHLLLGLVLAVAAISSAHAQTQNFSAPANKTKVTRERALAPLTRPAIVGAIPRAARGNPAQMVNPKAPNQYYGTPDDTVTYDQNNPSRITGIILYGLRF